MNNDAAVLSLRDVARVFAAGTEAEVSALAHVSLDVRTGELLAIVGPSGSGKSTLLNVLGLIDEPTSGVLSVVGRDAHSLTESEKDWLRATEIGFVFQESHVDGDATVAENVALGLRAQGTSIADCQDEVTEALRLVSLTKKSGAVAQLLSGGERQRVAIARAIAARPTVLLADEPTGSLDRRNGQAIIELLQGLARRGLAVVVITHDEHVAASADRVVHILDGELRDENIREASPVPRTIPSRRPAQFRGAMRDAANGVLRKPLRSLALIAAFALGSGGFVAASILSDTAAQQVSDRITAAGLDEVRVGADGTVRDDDLIRSINALPHVHGVGTVRQLDQGEFAVDRLPSDTVRGVTAAGHAVVADAEYIKLTGGRVEPAHALDVFSRDTTPNAVIVGEMAASELGLITPPTGDQTVTVNGETYAVIGVIVPSERDDSVGNAVFLPESSGLGGSQTYVVRTDQGFPAAVADAIPLAVKPGNPASVQVSTVADLRDLRRGVATDLGALVAYLALLLVSMATLGAGATMSLSVRARTSLIALRRAVGWSRRSVVQLFMAEGTALGTAGGILGTTIGLVVAMLVCTASGWVPSFNTTSLYVGVAAGFLSGIVASIVPANIAARLEPALALKSG